MGKSIIGLDVGSNSIGWAFLEESNGNPTKVIDSGSRIFYQGGGRKNTNTQ